VTGRVMRVASHLPDLEDHVAAYGRGRLVDELRAALRMLRGRPDPLSPASFREGEPAIVLADEVRLLAVVADPRRRALLLQAITHHHLDRWRPFRGRVTAAAEVGTPAALRFAVVRLGARLVAFLPGGPVDLLAARAAELDVPALADLELAAVDIPAALPTTADVTAADDVTVRAA
jgi:hypothetical protein